jgi:hypothetical protein
VNNSKTILALVFLMAGTLLTTTAVSTMVPAAYAEGDDHDDDNGDGNKNKAEDESAASIADCDDNDVDRFDFLCFGIAANDVEIETAEEEPPEEESTTLSVCKSTTIENTSPSSFTFTVDGNNPSDDEFTGDNSDGCVDITIGPGPYAVTETGPSVLTPFNIQTEDGCVQEDGNPQRATGEIEAGETRERCIFLNSPRDE